METTQLSQCRSRSLKKNQWFDSNRIPYRDIVSMPLSQLKKESWIKVRSIEIEQVSMPLSQLKKESIVLQTHLVLQLGVSMPLSQLKKESLVQSVNYAKPFFH